MRIKRSMIGAIVIYVALEQKQNFAAERALNLRGPRRHGNFA
jgi:hypothetical protein